MSYSDRFHGCKRQPTMMMISMMFLYILTGLAVIIGPPMTAAESLNRQLVIQEMSMEKFNEFDSMIPYQLAAGIRNREKNPCNESLLEDGQMVRFESGTGCSLTSKPDSMWFASYFIISLPIETDYVKANLKVCGRKDSKVLVFDEISKREIRAFANSNKSANCDNWNDLTPITFISDSNKVRIEYSAFRDHSMVIKKDGHIELTFTVFGTDELPESEIVFHLSIEYEPVEFKEFTIETSQDAPLSIDEYHPNSCWKFVIKKPDDDQNSMDEHEKRDYKVGAIIEVTHLDLDFDKNDFLLIGSGTKPDIWIGSKVQLVTHSITNTNGKIKFWVHADSAFIIVVTHNSLRKISKTFEANWLPANTTIKNNTHWEVPNRIKLSSMQLCFDESCFLWRTKTQNKFVEEFVHHLNEYLVEHEPNISILVNKESILIYDIETYPRFSNTRSNTNARICQINLAVTSPYDPEYPLMSRESLHRMYFGSGHSRKFLRQTKDVNDCSFPTVTWKKIIIPILIILIVSALVTVGFWRIQMQLIRTGYTSLLGHKNG